MATIGSLVVDMSANVAALKTDLDKGRRAFDSFSANVTSSFGRIEAAARGIRNGLAALGLTLGAKALVDYGLRLLDTAGSLGELAQQLGVTAKNLQVYQYAASQAGISTGELETSLAHFARTVGDAAAGSKTAVEAFRAVGVTALDPGDIDKAFRQVADGIAKIPDPARQAAAAADLFGKSGQRMLTVLSGGAAGIDDFRRQAEELGIVLDDQMIANADKASDQLKTLGFVIESELTRAIVGLAPEINKLVKEFIDGLPKLTAWVDEMFNLGIATDQSKLALEQQRLIDLQKEAQEIAIGLGQHPPGSESFLGGLLGTSDRDILLARQEMNKQRLIETETRINELEGLVAEHELGRAETQGAGKTGGGEKELKIVSNAKKELTELEKLRKRAREGLTEAQTQAAEEQEKDREAASKRAQEIIKQGQDISAGYRQELEDKQKLNAALDEGQQAYAVEAKYQEIANRFREAGLPLYGAEIDKAKELAGQLVDLDRLREVTDAMREFGNTIQDDVVGGITGLVSGTEELDDVLKQLLQDVARGLLDILNKSSATGSVGESLFKSLIGDIPSMWASTGGGNLSSDVGGMMAANPELFAAGGRPPVGEVSIVGEKGPELFVPDASGTVLPNGVLQQLGRGGMTVNIDARGATRDAVPAMMEQLAALQAEQVRLRRDVAPMAVAAVGNERRRSTGYARTFAGRGAQR